MRCPVHMKVTEILRLKEINLFNYRGIATSVNCSKTTGGKILSRYREHGLIYADASQMTKDQNDALIYPDSFGSKQVKSEPDWEAILHRLDSYPRTQIRVMHAADFQKQ